MTDIEQFFPFKRWHNTHFGVGKWCPDTNFLTFNADELLRIFPESKFISIADLIVSGHELPHSINRSTGTIINMVGFCQDGSAILLAMDKIGSKAARKELLIREVANNRLFLSADHIVELESVFDMDAHYSILQNLNSCDASRYAVELSGEKPEDYLRGFRERHLPLLDAFKKDILRNKEVEDWYNKLSFLTEHTSCPYLPELICRFALDIPYPLDPLKIAFQAYFLEEPKNRLQVLLEFFEDLERKKPLMNWKPISIFVKYHDSKLKKGERLYEANLSWASLYRWLEQITGLKTANYPSRERNIFFELIAYNPIETILVRGKGENWDSYNKKICRILTEESSLDKIFDIFDKANVISRSHGRIRRFYYSILMYFICIGWIQNGKVKMIPNPLVPDKVLEAWRYHWCYTYITNCILSNRDIETLSDFGMKFSEPDLKQMKQKVTDLSTTESESYLEDLYRKTNEEIKKKTSA